MERLLVTTLAIGLLLVSACREEAGPATGGAPPAQPPAHPMPGQPMVMPPAADAGTGAAALRWTAPAGWVAEAPTTRMRKAQYRVPGEAGDAECIVFYFGPGEGGDAMANAQRWAGQFTLADGRPGIEGMKTETRKVGNIDVLTVEVAGTYQGGFRMQQQNPPPKPNQLLLAAVAEGPDANWFFRLLGPQATVEQQRGAFEELIASFERGGQP